MRSGEHPIPMDTSTDNGAVSGIGWYNEETGEWDKAEPDMPAFLKEEQRGQRR